ncbi:MAG: hypothetical protein RLZZ175_977 [Bacteroidota bacterium]|jgi:hypothetical protein
MSKQTIRMLSAFFIIFCGTTFILSSIGVIFTLVLGGNLSNYFINQDGDSEFGWYKAQFWIVIISFITLLLAGGSLKRINIFSNFPYKEEDK